MRFPAPAPVALLATCLYLGPLSAHAQANAGDVAFDAAMQAYEASHWAQAFAAMAQLADAGHPRAACVAQQMWAFGPRLYGAEFEASRARLEAWARLRPCLPAARAVR